MTPSSDAAARPGTSAAAYFAARRAMVDGFVRRHMTWPGTLRLHGAALGADVLRAPVNVMLSPLLVLMRIGAWACGRLHVPRAAAWLGSRRLLLRTAVAARVEAAILTDLLEVPLPAAPALPDREDLVRAILAAPRLREMLRTRGSPDAAQATADRIVAALGEYTGTRSAMAEFTTALLTLAVGAVAFHALTPGVISLAPGIAGTISRSAAVAEFPLGQTLGGLWYDVFPVGPSPWLMAATVAGLVLAGSVVAAFAGVIADPVQVRLGMHRRRLLRLIDTIEAEIAGRGDRPFVAREHYAARLFDLWDAALSVLRALRG
ncbi:MAG: hypothetical protein IE927_14805 [Rhodobacterales bacterium]|nr:hypothetical protein [Rhodobacterales bacterium]